MNSFTKHVIVAAAIGLSLTSTASYGITLNGPDLDGTRIHMQTQSADPIAVPTKEFQGLGNCQPWECGVNGPDLDGKRTDAVAPKTHAALTINGPDLNGINAATQIFSPEKVLGLVGNLGGCEPWQCGVNGPDLDGTRVYMRIQNADPIAAPNKEYQGLGNCNPWQCGVNGPDLDGTRAHMRIQNDGTQITNPIIKFTDLLISSYR